VISVLVSGAVGPGFISQPRRCQVTVLGKLFTPIGRRRGREEGGKGEGEKDRGRELPDQC